MGNKTAIEWTDSTWNPIRGCSKVSPGCANCYAEAVARRFHAPGLAYEGVATDRGWTGKVKLVEKHLGDPLRWKKPRRIFVNSMSDLFHEALSFEDIAAPFAVMLLANQHTYQILTKRPDRMKAWFEWIENAEEWGENVWTRLCRLAARHFDPAKWEKIIEDYGLEDANDFHDEPWPLPNVWLGVSVEDQKTADERIPVLLQTPAAVRFVSAEPLLGPVDFSGESGGNDYLGDDYDKGENGINWIIVGGESGPGARECKLEWIRDIVNQCSAAKTACFVKQLGSKPVDYYNTEPWEPAGEAPYNSWSGPPKDKKGGDIDEFPADLRVREFPKLESKS